MSSNPVNRLERAWPRAILKPGEVTTIWKDKAERWEKDVEKFIVDYPKIAITAAALVGLLVGWMVKRK